ncbi:MAG: hypothetical protein CMO80_20165 [Verrucomicrobiales bacterium]|nr:hypothetical protein [Verrucomicrobiales bacterium]
MKHLLLFHHFESRTCAIAHLEFSVFPTLSHITPAEIIMPKRFPTFLFLLVVSGHLQSAELLDFANGKKPNHTGYGRRTEWSLVRHRMFKDRVLKVKLTAGDSFGMNRSGILDWTPYGAVEFKVFNPSGAPVDLQFVLRHSGSMDNESRVTYPMKIQPGVHAIKIKLEDLKRADGARPGFRYINHWFVRSIHSTPNLYFNSFHLTGEAPIQIVREQSARSKRIRPIQKAEVPSSIDCFTPEADRILAALEVFPADNPWNTPVDQWPVHPESRQIISSIGVTKSLQVKRHLNFVFVPVHQARIDVQLGTHAHQSDIMPIPVPQVALVEGWPAPGQSMGSRSKLGSQLNQPPSGGPRRSIIIDPVKRLLWELQGIRKTANGWAAEQASFFDLKQNRHRKEGWRSADAAGLPLFPGVVRYDEMHRGMIEHAMRFTVKNVRSTHVLPARTSPGNDDRPSLPRMGERLRLRGDFKTEFFSAPVAAILDGLKKYGMIVAEVGEDWTFSATTDRRIVAIEEELSQVTGIDFEVVTEPVRKPLIDANKR